MDQETVHRIHKAVETAREAALQARLDRCDLGDLDEVIQTVERELSHPTPNKTTLTMMLNSLAKSLQVTRGGEQARQEIDSALQAAGLPATWKQ